MAISESSGYLSANLCMRFLEIHEMTLGSVLRLETVWCLLIKNWTCKILCFLKRQKIMLFPSGEKPFEGEALWERGGPYA